MIPANALAIHTRTMATPKRKVGIGATTRLAIQAEQDTEIVRLDRQGEPRWRIAIRMGITERQVYRRLRRIRAVALEAQAEEDEGI